MWVILGTQGESITWGEKRDKAKAQAEGQSVISGETREVKVTQNCGSNEPIKGASGRRVIKPGNAVGWSSDQPVDVATVGSRGAVRATGSFPWVKPGWEMREQVRQVMHLNKSGYLWRDRAASGLGVKEEMV